MKDNRIYWLRIALLGLVALVIHGTLNRIYYHPDPKTLVGDEHYYAHLGTSLYKKGTTVHDPLWPPLYGELIAWSGPNITELRVHVQVVQVGLWAITGLLWWQITRRLTESNRTAWILAAIYVSSIELSAFCSYLWPETLHLCLFSGAIWCFLDKRHITTFFGVFLLASCLFTKSLLLPSAPLILIWHGYTMRHRNIKMWVLMVCAAAFLAYAATWAMRGQITSYFGQSASFNLLVGLSDKQYHDHTLETAGPILTELHAETDGYVDRNSAIKKRLIQEITVAKILTGVPSKLARVMDRHSFFVTQLPDGDRASYQGPMTLSHRLLKHGTQFHTLICFLLAVVGIALGYRRTWPLWVLPLVCAAIFAIIHTKSRYLIQLLPIIYLYAAMGLNQMFTSPRLSLNWQQSIGILIVSTVFLIIYFG